MAAHTRQPAVHIMAGGRNGTIYVGVTSNLVQRVSHHRTRSGPGFTTRYACTRRDRFERYDDTPTAIARENNSKPAPGPANSP